MAEKNIAALVREDTKTIGVRFYKKFENSNTQGTPWSLDQDLNADLSAKTYTYVTHLDFKLQDIAIVKAAGSIQCSVVVRVDEGCEIEPNQDVKFSWVIDKVNQEDYEAQMEINKQLEQTVNKAYKQNVKNQFRQLVLGSIDSESAAKINMLLGVMPKS